jgi:hypothetical protein
VSYDARENGRDAVQADPLRREVKRAEREALNRLWRACMLAQDVETLEALLANQPVPIDRLDPVWVARLRTSRPRQ